MRSRTKTVVSSQIHVAIGTSGRIAITRGPSARLFHGGYIIVVGQDAGGWWARIEELCVETMLFADAPAAFAAAMDFVDGMTNCVRKKTLWNGDWNWP